ncbi:TPA: hypothetical protein EYP70_07385 [Candidatus Bathyarchaeota archaeon]|nr:hypothetical protein [Candidatus Bathyarchaeota archaeon]
MEEDFSEQEVERDVEVTEISLSDDEIEEWITKLQLLRESKEPISLEIDDENELAVNYEEDAE